MRYVQEYRRQTACLMTDYQPAIHQIMEQTLGVVTQRCTQTQFQVRSEPTEHSIQQRSPPFTNCYQLIDARRMNGLDGQ